MNYLAYFKNEDEIRKCIADNVFKIRVENKLTQEELAELLDVSAVHISRIENCKYTCSVSFLLKFCSKFKMDINDFFHVNPSTQNNIIHFLNTLSLEKYDTIIEFFEEIKKHHDQT